MCLPSRNKFGEEDHIRNYGFFRQEHHSLCVLHCHRHHIYFVCNTGLLFLVFLKDLQFFFHTKLQVNTDIASRTALLGTFENKK